MIDPKSQQTPNTRNMKKITRKHIISNCSSCKEKNPKRSQREVKTLLFQTQKLKEFINSKQTLQEMLKAALAEDVKRPRWKPR